MSAAWRGVLSLANVAISLVAIGCGSPPADADSPRTTEVDYSHPLEHVDLSPSAPGPRLDPDFHEILFVSRLNDGRLVVVDNGSRVRIFSEGNATVRTIGGFGEGPGEFLGIDAVHVSSDSEVITYDLRLRRTITFDTTGVVVAMREVPIQGPMLATPLSSGEVVAAVPEIPVDLSRGYRRAKLRVFASREGARMEGPDVAGPGWFFSGRDASIIPCPYTHRPLLHATDSLVVFGTESGVGFHWTRPGSADTLGTVMRSGSGSTVATSSQLALADSLLEYHRGGLESFRTMADAECPERPVPMVSRLLVGPQARVWVGRETPWTFSEPRLWEVYSIDGAWLATVRVPDHFRVSNIHAGELLGIHTNALGVETPMVLTLPF